MKKLSLVVLDRFKRLYREVPAVACKGLCQDSCGMVPMTEFEWGRLLNRVPNPVIQVETQPVASCPHLNKEGKCDVHDIRPLLCRLYGVAAGMPCPHGCVSRGLTDREAFFLLQKADEIGGGTHPGQMEIVYAASEHFQKSTTDR